MKRLCFVLFACVLAVGVKAQYDTIGKYPYLYHYNWPKTGVWYGDSLFCAVHWYLGDRLGVYVGVSNYTSNYALYQHTDTPLEIIGLAMGWGIGTPGCQVKTTLYDSAMNELACVYGMYSQHHPAMLLADTSAHHFYIPGQVSWSPLSQMWDTNSVNTSRNYIYFRFFDKSVIVSGDYYIGLSDSTIVPQVAYLVELHDDSNGDSYVFPTSGPSHFQPCAVRIKYNSGIWSDTVWRSPGAVPVLFAIVKLPCEAVDSMTVTVGPDGCLWADWGRPRVQSAWTVRLVLPDGSDVMQTVDTNHWEYCGLSPNQSYTVYLRSRCDELGGGHSWSDWSAAFGSTYSPTQSVADAGRLDIAVTLRPNPARDAVTVSAEGVEEAVTVSVTDIAGVEVLRREGVRLPLTLSTASLAAGTYVVRVVTPQGAAVQKLTVR